MAGHKRNKELNQSKYYLRRLFFGLVDYFIDYFPLNENLWLRQSQNHANAFGNFSVSSLGCSSVNYLPKMGKKVSSVDSIPWINIKYCKQKKNLTHNCKMFLLFFPNTMDEKKNAPHRKLPFILQWSTARTGVQTTNESQQKSLQFALFLFCAFPLRFCRWVALRRETFEDYV